MKIFKTLLMISFFLLFIGGFWFYLEHAHPSYETVKKEFLMRNPNTDVVSIELIFEDPRRKVLTYSVKFKSPESGEILMDDFAMKRKTYFQWESCNDQTERKCY